MSFNTGDIVRIVDGGGVPGLTGTEARVLGRTSDVFGSFYETELVADTISDETREVYEQMVPEFLRDEEPIELMNFDEGQLELVQAAQEVA